MTKKDIVIELAKRFNLTQVDTKNVVQGTFDAITEIIAQEGRIELRNFGVFEIRRRKPRKARNPKTGEQVTVPEKLIVRFKPGRKMEERVAQSGLADIPDETYDDLDISGSGGGNASASLSRD